MTNEVTTKHRGSLSGQPQHHIVLKMGRSSGTNVFQQSTDEGYLLTSLDEENELETVSSLYSSKD